MNSKTREISYYWLNIVAIFGLFLSQCFCLANSKSDNNNTNNSNDISESNIQGRNSCDVYKGKWVFENSYPLYNSSKCPFIRNEFNCLKYGRPDRSYLKFRWQPSACDLPRLNGGDLLRTLMGKKIMFIGDSISVDHGQSLICLLHSAVPNSNITQNNSGSISSVTFQDFGVSIMIFNAPYLVDIEVEKNFGRVLKLNSMKKGNIWKDMDILVFNTWLWWYRRDKQPWDYIQDGETIIKDMDRMEAFKKGLTTWAKWVDSTIEPAKTRVFFQGISPSHYDGKGWNRPEMINCAKETLPISGSSYPGGTPKALYVVKNVLSTIKKPVHLLDITTLSQLRKDGHPSSYNVFKGMDCTHWCIAGVQDTWNHLLYVALMAQEN